MKLWILYDTKFGNGKTLAELLKKEFSDEWEIKLGDVKEISPSTVASDAPDALILGGAIRMFMGAPASKKWLKQLNKELYLVNKEIQYGTVFLTHGLSTNKVQGYNKRFWKKLKKSNRILKIYPQTLTARVKEMEGPFVENELEKAKEYVHKFTKWIES
ncbi:MAG: flavodoxin domain-containing protein [Promethearchaeota archaeon]